VRPPKRSTMIHVENLTKVFNVRKRKHGILNRLAKPEFEKLKAVDDVSFSAAESEVLCLLGPNGAGKSTIMKIVCGLLQPTSGRVSVGETAPARQSGNIGLVLGRTMIYHRLTGYDNLEYYGMLYGVGDLEGRIEELSRLFGLGDWMGEYVEHYSNGMKSKLALARALIHDPDILLLDEPTLGLDVGVSKGIHEMILGLRKTVLLTTQDMEEARTLSDRVVILRDGRVTREIGNPREVDIRREFMNEIS